MVSCRALVTKRKGLGFGRIDLMIAQRSAMNAYVLKHSVLLEHLRVGGELDDVLLSVTSRSNVHRSWGPIRFCIFGDSL